MEFYNNMSTNVNVNPKMTQQYYIAIYNRIYLFMFYQFLKVLILLHEILNRIIHIVKSTRRYRNPPALDRPLESRKTAGRNPPIPYWPHHPFSGTLI